VVECTVPLPTVTVTALAECSRELIWWEPVVESAVAVTATNRGAFYRARMTTR
jgi:hypothetical protein